EERLGKDWSQEQLRCDRETRLDVRFRAPVHETVLPSLTHENLKELGVTALGHRLKLLVSFRPAVGDLALLLRPWVVGRPRLRPWHSALCRQPQRHSAVHALAACLGYRYVALDPRLGRSQLNFEVTLCTRSELQPGDFRFRACDQEAAFAVGLEAVELGLAG